MKTAQKRSTIQLLQEFSIPLIVGVIAALVAANLAPSFYHEVVHRPITKWWQGDVESTHVVSGMLGRDESLPRGHADDSQLANFDQQHQEDHDLGHDVAIAAHDSDGWHHFFTMHFLVNDLFMVLFFGIAAKEITEAFLPGGALNPMSKAVNPLLGTLGGVLGPAGLFLLLNGVSGTADWAKGWGIPTATDIALAWLIARFIFGAGHPAISFLLLLAVADDAIGLGIIAIAYPDPLHPTVWANALWIVPGMLVAFTLRKMRVANWLPYVMVGGALCWWGLYSAHLHPALALVFVVPFMPGHKRDFGLFTLVEGELEGEPNGDSNQRHHEHPVLPLIKFEHDLKLFVDFGLFFFAFANAGVPFAGITTLTWILVASLIVGKTVGITLFAVIGQLLGFRLPEGMNNRHLVVAGMVAGVGLTVALFVAGQAFTDPATQGAAKMGALFSGFAFIVAWSTAKLLGVGPGQFSMDEAPSAVPNPFHQDDLLGIEPSDHGILIIGDIHGELEETLPV